jgi:hypothetical protein
LAEELSLAIPERPAAQAESRKRGGAYLLRALEDELNKKVKLKGKRRRKRKGELLITKLRAEAASGKAKSIGLLERVRSQKPNPADPNNTLGVLLIPYAYMTREQWLERFGGKQLTEDPLEGLPGIDAAMMKRAMAEKRRLAEEGYNDAGGTEQDGA